MAKKVDTWALGCVFYVMVTGFLPFTGAKTQMMHNIVKGKYKPLPSFVTSDCSKLIQKILVVDPAQRPSLEEILESKVFNKHGLGTEHSRASISKSFFANLLIALEVKEERDPW
jgi:serine/threonine protein kinase